MGMRYFLVLVLFSTAISVKSAHCHEIDELISELVINASSALFLPGSAVSALLCAKKGTCRRIIHSYRRMIAHYMTSLAAVILAHILLGCAVLNNIKMLHILKNVVMFSKILSASHILNNCLDWDDFEKVISQYKFHQTLILLDLDCPQAIGALSKANASRMFSAPLKWLVLKDETMRNSSDVCTNDCLLRDFHQFTMYPDSEVIIFRRISKDYVKILSVYRPSPVRDMMVEERGFWRTEEGIRTKGTHVASRRRRNLLQTPLKSSLVVTNPDTLNHLTDYRDKHVDTITKCNYFWLHHLVDAMNATVSYSVVNSWGYRDKNGSWNGLMGLLSRKEIDIGGTSMFLVGDRWDDAHYIPLSTPTRAGFIFRQPPLSFVSNLFTLPFRRSVWIAVGILLTLILVLLMLATRWEWHNRHNDSTLDSPPAPTLSDNLLLIVGVAAQQGFGRSPRTVPSRIVLLMLLLAGLNLYASYSANIVALLQATTTSIQTLKDLLESPIKCGAQDIVYNRHYFKLEKDPIRRGLIDQKIEPKTGKSNWMSADEGIRNVRQGFFAFFMETGPGYKIIQETFEEDEKCGFREMYFIEHFDPMFAIVKQSPYVEIIRVNALKIEESGLKSRQMSRLYTKRPPCNGLSKFISVGLNECYFAFYTMSLGALLAIGVFILEFLWSKRTSLRWKTSNAKGSWYDGE